MAEYIDLERVLDFLHHCYPTKWQGTLPDGRICHYSDVIDGVAAIPAADVEPVRRCATCRHYLKEHVETDTGEIKYYDEMPKDAFDDLGTGLVTVEYGINVGGQCMVDENSGYSESKKVFRRPDDFCSRWGGAKMNEEART